MPSYPPRLAALLEDLSAVDDREIRSELLIELADRFEPVPVEIACRPYPDSHKVPGCESEVYVWSVPASETSNRLRFYFAVENPQGLSAKAMAVLIDETLSGAPLEQVLAVEDDIVAKIFGGAISMGKGQGLMNMVRVVKALATTELKKRGIEQLH